MEGKVRAVVAQSLHDSHPVSRELALGARHSITTFEGVACKKIILSYNVE
jgi:hypothetical protein